MLNRLGRIICIGTGRIKRKRIGLEMNRYKNENNESRPFGQLSNGWRGRIILRSLPTAPMSSYELFTSVTEPIVGPHVDGTIFRTLCKNNDRHLNNDYWSHKQVFEEKREGRKLAHPFYRDKKRASSQKGKNALLTPITADSTACYTCLMQR